MTAVQELSGMIHALGLGELPTISYLSWENLLAMSIGNGWGFNIFHPMYHWLFEEKEEKERIIGTPWKTNKGLSPSLLSMIVLRFYS